MRESGNEIDEALFVLGAGVALVVCGVDWLTEHLQAFTFGVVDQVGIGRRALPCIENHTDPSVGGRQIRGQIEVHLVVRNGINRKAEPREKRRLVGSGEDGTIFRKKHIVGNGEVIQGKLARLSFAGLGTIRIHPRQLGGGGLVSCIELDRGHVVRSSSKGSVQFLFGIPRSLISEVIRSSSCESHPTIIEHNETKPIRKRRPIEGERHSLRRDVKCQIRPRGVERTATNRSHVCRV